MHDELLGSTQLVLSISLKAGETIVAETGGFSWMTDSIQMSADAGTDLTEALRHTLAGSSLHLSAYTARHVAGTIAFASRLSGSIVGIDVTPDNEFLVHREAFLAGTPGIEVTTGFQQRMPGAEADEFILRRISGCGRAWVELSGQPVRRDLAAGSSLRTHPGHIGMCSTSIAVQLAEFHRGAPSAPAGQLAVLSGPGPVWLQSMYPLPPWQPC